MIGGIDLGGTKIEARLFDGPDARTVDLRRCPTPQDSYEALLDAVSDQIRWLEARAGDPHLPVGLAMPGTLDPATGISFAANVPTTGRAPTYDLAARHARPVPVVNDGMAFALSEATVGAAAGHRSVMGLVLGTGVGGGLCLDGALPHRHAGLAVEIGHVGLSAAILRRHDLPALPCGCGRSGCVETLISGTGLATLAGHVTGTPTPADAQRDERVLSIWADLAGDTLATIQMLLDPDAIVLGGGLSRMPDVVARLTAGLAANRLGTARAPLLLVAQHGDSSGARGAALLAAAGRPR